MEPLVGEKTCRVHLAATVQSLMVEGDAVLRVQAIPFDPQRIHYCSCRLSAEFLVANLGGVVDPPFPQFQTITKETA